MIVHDTCQARDDQHKLDHLCWQQIEKNIVKDACFFCGRLNVDRDGHPPDLTATGTLLKVALRRIQNGQQRIKSKKGIFMKETILLVGHGSRDEEGNVEVDEFAQYWQSKHPDWRIEVCWIEHARVLPDAGLDKAAEGSDRVILLPLILNAAGHVKMELPEYLEQARLRHPQVLFLMGRHLGVDERILKLVRMRIHSAMVTLDMPDPKTTSIILLGRGSSDMSANGEVAKMARWVFETTRHDQVDYAFTGITYPRVETVVARQVASGAMQIIIAPYYLFTGRLIKRIENQVQRMTRQYPQIAFSLAGYLGINDRVVEVLESRLAEVREHSVSMMECDGCRIREIAHEHGLDHHH